MFKDRQPPLLIFTDGAVEGEWPKLDVTAGGVLIGLVAGNLRTRFARQRSTPPGGPASRSCCGGEVAANLGLSDV